VLIILYIKNKKTKQVNQGVLNLSTFENLLSLLSRRELDQISKFNFFYSHVFQVLSCVQVLVDMCLYTGAS